MDLQEIKRIMQENEELKARMRWIPVSERPPEDNQIVICYAFVFDNIAVARYCEREGSFYEYWRGGELTVTHWQPLPGKPEVKNE